MTDFHVTRMGHRFFESTLPELVRQLERLNDLLERLMAEGKGEATEGSGDHPSGR